MRLGMRLAAVLVSFLTTSATPSDLSPAEPYEMEDAYQIYSLVLPHEESYEFGKGTLVIQEDTVLQSLDSPSCLDPKSASRFKEALDDYRRVQKHKLLLQRQFQIEKPYELVSSDAINLFFKEHGIDGWEDFYKRYPGSGGFIVMSPVGFDKSKTLAVVYTGSSCGGLCGRWKFHLLQKINGKWKEVPGVTCETMS